MGHIVYIGIGSNLGDKIAHCEKAISEILNIDRHRLLSRSSLFKTRPIGYTAQDWFVNGVIKLESDLEPHDLFRALKDVESRLGRAETFRWGPREIDLDILLYDDRIIQTENLQIPHPHMHERQFVLIPLVEIEPELIHPVLKKSVQNLLKEAKEDQGVEKLKSFPRSLCERDEK
ncbi:MAG: 2-amino-4-hydroxy-6-hydroxymethyldihydropteridine diphosphokinase [Deltaproteobacteria bacterium RBG_16_49_23]|nr:MAG: 2-amino-4-hydroxy-6-hydroxymethyldihydropteridine diphosphokinase [Deltaproteobacteria bacterium RBG_16_49_23]